MRKAMIVGLVMMIAVFGVLSSSAQSKTSGATLSGVVLGADGKPVAHASVVYQSAGGRAPHAVHTDAKGQFTVTGLKQDNYDVRASANGMYSEWERNLMLRKGVNKKLTLKLVHAAAPTETPKPSPSTP
jgi:hypothetical protein